MKRFLFTALLCAGVFAALWSNWGMIAPRIYERIPLADFLPDTAPPASGSLAREAMPGATAARPADGDAGSAGEGQTEIGSTEVYVSADGSTVAGTTEESTASFQSSSRQSSSAQATAAHTMGTIYSRPPNIGGCDPGELAQTQKETVLDFVNEIRARHDLPLVRYAPEYDNETAQAALIIAANNQMTHFPTRSALCYTEAGAEGSATSNIAWGGPQEGYGEPLLAPSAVDVRNWFIDDEVPDLGHRRWILDPFLSQISYGRVDGPPMVYPSGQIAHGAALKVIFDEKATLPGDAPAFVAYPFGDYPLDLVKLGWYWSFSVLADPGNFRNNRNVDYGQAQVRVSGPNGDLPVHSVSFNTEGYGLSNHLQWQVRGTQIGETYQVMIDNVNVAGAARSYAYDVTIVEPNYSRAEAPVEEVDPGQIVSIRAGETVGIYADPSMIWPNGFRTSSQQVKSQSRSASPYLTLFWLDGTIGDQLRIPFEQGEVLVRITASRNGEQDPTVALAEDLSMPVYAVDTDGQEIVAEGPGEFAVYITPPADAPNQSIGRVRWTYETGIEMEGRILNDHTLTFSLAKAPAGARIEVTYGEGRSFTIRIAGDPVQGLREQLGVPVYAIQGNGERIQVGPNAYFALYLPEEVGQLARVSWRASPGLQMEGVVFSGQSLILQVQQAQAGMQATIDLGGGRTVILEIVA